MTGDIFIILLPWFVTPEIGSKIVPKMFVTFS